MSLFKARLFWDTTLGVNEEFDFGMMTVSNIDNGTDGAEKIVVGGFSGILRVFRPRGRGFSPDHVLAEHKTGFPILQIASGSFLS